MDEQEFDKFADEYYAIHSQNIRISGEEPEYFSEHKIRDMWQFLNGRQAKKILDFGAGVGNSIPFLRKYFSLSSVTCADVSGRSLEVSRARYPGKEEYLEINGFDLPLKENSFDVIFSACVFHHIDASEHLRWLKELRRVAAPGGAIFIFEHNPFNPLTRCVVHACPFDENAKLVNSRRLSRRIAAAGWEQVKVRYRVFFPRALARLRGLESYLYWLPLGAQYCIAANKPYRSVESNRV